MSGPFADRAAWVVGASSGIGATLARELAVRGARVAISARRTEQLEAVAAGRMTVVPADVTDPDGIAAAAATVRAALGPLDLVVLSAGFWQQMDATRWDQDLFRRHVEVNLLGMGAAIAAVLPDMLDRRHGHLVGIASVVDARGIPGAEGYGATKAAQRNLLEAVRAAVRHRGVVVTTVRPGFVRTEMTAVNDFPMPFLIDADRAARTICDGIARGRTEIVFPWQMAVLARVAQVVPPRLWAALLSRA